MQPARSNLPLLAIVLAGVLLVFGSTYQLRLVGSLLLAVGLASAQWRLFQRGQIETILGRFSRDASPRPFFLFHAILAITFIAAVVVSISHAMRAPGW